MYTNPADYPQGNQDENYYSESSIEKGPLSKRATIQKTQALRQLAPCVICSVAMKTKSKVKAGWLTSCRLCHLRKPEASLETTWSCAIYRRTGTGAH
jgi:hypothetical protein